MNLCWLWLVLLVLLGSVTMANAYYDPSAQRWLNRDPIGERGGKNLFTFTANNPVGLFDPDGLACDDPCGEAKRNGLDKGAVGGVVCCGGNKYSCVWKSGGATHASNSKATAIIDACVKAHEDAHQDDVDCPQQCITTRPPFRHPWISKKSECDSYKVHYDCLKNANCGGDPQCEQQVKTELKLVERRMNFYCGKYRSPKDSQNPL